jgi:membrane-associated phospholipid phosphatase
MAAYDARLLPRRAAAPAPAPARALALAAACVLALAAVWVLAELVPAVHLRDAAALYDFTLLDGPGIERLGNGLLKLMDARWYTLWAAVIVGVALARRQPRTALAVALALALTPISADILKPLLAHQHVRVGAVHISPASWPSGHSAAALSLALAAVLVAPTRLRPLVGAIGGVFALAVGCILLILAWHMPSDVLGGYLLASLWMALAVAALRAAEWQPRAGARSELD